jgi:hypothetical protein
MAGPAGEREASWSAAVFRRFPRGRRPDAGYQMPDARCQISNAGGPVVQASSLLVRRAADPVFSRRAEHRAAPNRKRQGTGALQKLAQWPGPRVNAERLGVRRASAAFPETGGQMPESSCRIPDAGYQMPDTRCQMPDARCQMPDIKCRRPGGAGFQPGESGRAIARPRLREERRCGVGTVLPGGWKPPATAAKMAAATALRGPPAWREGGHSRPPWAGEDLLLPRLFFGPVGQLPTDRNGSGGSGRGR